MNDLRNVLLSSFYKAVMLCSLNFFTGHIFVGSRNINMERIGKLERMKDVLECLSECACDVPHQGLNSE